MSFKSKKESDQLKVLSPDDFLRAAQHLFEFENKGRFTDEHSEDEAAEKPRPAISSLAKLALDGVFSEGARSDSRTASTASDAGETNNRGRTSEKDNLIILPFKGD